MLSVLFWLVATPIGLIVLGIAWLWMLTAILEAL